MTPGQLSPDGKHYWDGEHWVPGALAAEEGLNAYTRGPREPELLWSRFDWRERDLFDKQLSLVFEGFCPYCETQFPERVEERNPPSSKGPSVVVRARCSCCGGLFKAHNSKFRGLGWVSAGGHNCEHVGDWDDDEATHRIRFEYRDGRHWATRTRRNVKGLLMDGAARRRS